MTDFVLPTPSAVTWTYPLTDYITVTDVVGDTFEVQEIQVSEWTEDTNVYFFGYRLKKDGTKRTGASWGVIHLRHDDPLEAQVRHAHFQRRAFA